jgi:hypothetical protein
MAIGAVGREAYAVRLRRDPTRVGPEIDTGAERRPKQREFAQHGQETLRGQSAVRRQ